MRATPSRHEAFRCIAVELFRSDERPGPTPEHAATSMAMAGLVSQHAVGYAAGATGSANLEPYVDDVLGVRVVPGLELVYAVLPEWNDGCADVRDAFGADAVALDLTFADGGRLRDLGVRDQYGVPLDPLAQHTACTLQPDQWNLIRVPLDAAVGRVISGIELRFTMQGTGTDEAPIRTGWLDAIAVRTRTPLPDRPCERVRTRQGTMSTQVISRGNTVPAVGLPNGFVSAIPVTRADSYAWPYGWHADNRHDNRPAIQAFASSHLPSPWLGERGAFQVMPALASDTVPATPADRALGFDHEHETGQPHRYDVALDGGIDAELTAAEHTTLMRFRFPVGHVEAVLVFDQIEGTGVLDLPTADPARPDAIVTAFTDDALGDGLGTGRDRFLRSFLHAHVDRPVLAAGMLPVGPDESLVRETDRSAARGWVRVGLGPDRTVTVRMATSFISIEQAARNLVLDGAQEPFDDVAERAGAAWDDWIGRVTIDGASDEQQHQLATCLYRIGLYPARAHENLGSADQPAPHYASPFRPGGEASAARTGSRVVAGELSVNHGFWDVYRTAWPMYTLLDPGLASRLLDGFAEHFRDGGWTSRWSAPGPVDSMTGTSNDIVFAHAVAVGVPVRLDVAEPNAPQDRRLDLWAAYESAVRNATVPSPSPLVGRKGLETSLFRGWVDTRVPEGACWTIDGSINDLAVAVLSRALLSRLSDDHPRRDELETADRYFTARAGSHRAVFDESVGFYQGRDARGEFRVDQQDYDPRIWGFDYTETTGWGTAFATPHDGTGLASLHGGREAMAAKLQELLDTPERGGEAVRGSYPTVIHEITEARNQRLGMLALSNQPAHHIPYMALFAGRPDLTQDLVRTATERLFTGGEIGQGWPGDEDNGELSAWWLFATLGLYPLVPGSGGYVLTAPAVPRAQVRLGVDTVLTIEAPAADRAHRYIRGVEIDGEPWSSTYVPHDVIARGATIRVDLATEPQPWGAQPEDEPPSLTPRGRHPAALRDLTAARRGASSDAGDAARVLDDDSSTRPLALGPQQVVVIDLDAPAAPAFVTVTPLVAGDYAWRVECELDGAWQVVDRRRERFPWPRQTRPFQLTAPPSATRWRFVAVSRIGLAQLELLVVDDG